MKKRLNKVKYFYNEILTEGNIEFNSQWNQNFDTATGEPVGGNMGRNFNIPAPELGGSWHWQGNEEGSEEEFWEDGIWVFKSEPELYKRR